MPEKVYLYVTPFFPSPTSWRGAYCLDFVKALKRALEVKVKDQGEQWKVVVFTEGDGSDYEIEGVKVHAFKARYLPSNIFPFLFKKFNQRSFFAKVKEVLPCRGVEGVEVCHCHTANFAVYAEALKSANPKCKTLLHHHDLASFGLNMGALRHCWLHNLIQFPLLRKLHEKIDTHVFISEAARRSFLAAPDTSWTQYEDYKKQMRGLPWRPVKIKNSIILHNGVDKSIFHPTTYHLPPTTYFTIGCVGNFEEWKDQETLIRAVGLIDKPIHVVFIGSGRLLEECKNLAQEIENKFLSTPTPKTFIFKSEAQHSDLADFYRSLDLFVVPALFEGFGCVFTEAHSCGVPFITCEGQGMDDIIPEEDREKWLCKIGDAEDLASKIKMYIDLRYEQRLTEDQSIDSLVSKFLQELNV